MTITKQTLGFSLIGLIVSIGLVFFRAETLTLENALLAVAIMWVGMMPSVVFLELPKAERSPFPLMPLTGIFYAVFFGFPAFIAYYLIGSNDTRIQFYGHRYIDAISLEAQILVLVGIVLMFLAWVIGKRYLFKLIPAFTLPKPCEEPSLILIAWALALSSLAYWMIPEISSLPSIGQFLQPAGYLAFAIFYLFYSRGRLNWVNKVAYFFMVLPAWLGCLIASGSLTPVLLFFTLWIVLRITFTPSVPKIVIIVPLILVLVYPYVNEFREKYWVASDQSSVISKVIGFGSIVARGILADEVTPQTALGPLHGLVRRVSLVLPMSQVVYATPEQVTYWNGVTYQTLFTGWIPRVIWRDKPKESWGNIFGRKFNIIAPEDKLNSINIPWITEMYANFGRSGVLVGMILVGLFLGFLDRFLNSPNRNISEQAIGATALLPLFFQESNFTLMTGSLFPLILCFWLLFSIGLRIKLPWSAQ